jgi:V/A-type H+-transporting ATPase subunit F
MYKIGVIGDKDSVLGFMAVGFTVFIADDMITAGTALRQAAREGYAVIFVVESTALLIGDIIAEYRTSPLPAIIVIPGKSGSRGMGMAEIRKSVERAVGADILFRESN